MPTTRVWIPLLALLTAACIPPGVQVSVPYRIRADASSHSLPCAKREFADLGFIFVEEPGARRALGSLISPSRQSIEEAHDVMTRCQASPLS